MCPDHWTRNEDTCYFHDMSLVTFGEASQKCDSFNATLVSIHSIKQNDWINRFVSEQNTWLGGISNLEEKNVVTDNGKESEVVTSIQDSKESNQTQVPRVTITVTKVSQNKSEERKWKWIDGSVFNYWIWSKGDWFGRIPKQPDCNGSCCIIFMNQVGSWEDEDCRDLRPLASTLCGLRFGAIPSKSSVVYETESKQTISVEVSMVEKMLNYIGSNFVSKDLLDFRSNQLVERTEINRKELMDRSVGSWIIPVIIIISFILVLLIATNIYLFCRIKKVHIFSTINLGRLNFKTLNNQISEESVTANEDVWTRIKSHCIKNSSWDDFE